MPSRLLSESHCLEMEPDFSLECFADPGGTHFSPGLTVAAAHLLGLLCGISHWEPGLFLWTGTAVGLKADSTDSTDRQWVQEKGRV